MKLTGLKKLIMQSKKEGIAHPSDYERFTCKDLCSLHVRCLSQIVNRLAESELFTKSDISKSEFIALNHLDNEGMSDLLVINTGTEKACIIITSVMANIMNNSVRRRSNIEYSYISESKLDECLDAISDYFGICDYDDLVASLDFGIIMMREEIVKQIKGGN